MNPILEIKNLVKHFPVNAGLFSRSREYVHAVDGVNFTIQAGETFGLVGESGCGKSTVAQLLLRLLDPDAGQILFDGRDISQLSHKQMKPLRKEMQIIFQDPYASLNPRMMVQEILTEPFLIHKIGSRVEREKRVAELLNKVGLPKSAASRYPHEFSGGQRQRIGIARAIALKPKLIVADEPVSALDVSIRGEIINLLLDLQKEEGLSYLFISHDLRLVEHISHRIAVMYLGKIVETFPAEALGAAKHPYTHALVSAVPKANPHEKKKRILLSGDVPSPVHPPSACSFHPRCKWAKDVCSREVPVFEAYQQNQFAACHFKDTIPPLSEELFKG